MALTLDTITLGVPQAEAAYNFYVSAFSPPDAADNGQLDLHGTGQLALRHLDSLASEANTDAATSGFRGCVMSSIVSSPGEVEALLEAATAAGARVIKPAKKQLFGEFTAVYEAPDGAVWKLAAASKKDTAPVPHPPKPIETAIYLGVAKPKTSKVFYKQLGMSPYHDYGDKFIDFTIANGQCRLGLLPRKGLAKDVGVDENGDGFSTVVLTHTAASRDEVDALLETVDTAGGRVTVAAIPTHQGDYAGHFTDPDGFHWKVTTPG